MQRKQIPAPLDKSRVPGFYGGVGPQMLIGVQINGPGLKNQRFEDIFKLTGPVHRFYTGHARRIIFAVFVPFPQVNSFIGLLHKQDFPVLFFFSIRTDHQDALLLIDSAEVKQVCLLNKPMDSVGTGGHDIVGVKNSNRFLIQFFGKTPAVLNK